MHLRDRERAKDEPQVAPGVVMEAAWLSVLANDSRGFEKTKPVARTAGKNQKVIERNLPVGVFACVRGAHRFDADRPVL